MFLTVCLSLSLPLSLHPVFFSRAQVEQFPAEYTGGLCRPPGFSLCEVLSSLPRLTGSSHDLGLPELELRPVSSGSTLHPVPPSVQHSEGSKQQAGAIMGLTSFVSHFSGVTVLHRLRPRVLKKKLFCMLFLFYQLFDVGG